jgi:hypothetical protein
MKKLTENQIHKATDLIIHIIAIVVVIAVAIVTIAAVYSFALPFICGGGA